MAKRPAPPIPPPSERMNRKFVDEGEGLVVLDRKGEVKKVIRENEDKE